MTDKKEHARLFIATFFDKDVLSLVKPLQSLDEGFSANLRHVSPEKIHLTWKFIGDFPVSEIPNLVNEVNAASGSIKNTTLNMTGVKIWPNKRNPRQIVITSNEENPVIHNFFNTLEHRLLEFNIDMDSRRFNPHITIARFKKDTRCPGSILYFTPVELCINNVHVVESNFSEYKIIK